jgi:hypothetical protein
VPGVGFSYVKTAKADILLVIQPFLITGTVARIRYPLTKAFSHRIEIVAVRLTITPFESDRG